MQHPFAELIGLEVRERSAGHSVCTVLAVAKHMNPHGVVHGSVLHALADTGMGAALYPTLVQGELCATIQITINYLRATREGELRCETRLVNRGRRVANLHSRIYSGEELVASADGNYSIFAPSSGSSA